MVRLPAWAAKYAFHSPAQSGPPGPAPFHHPIPRLSIYDFTEQIKGVPLQPGQAQGLIGASGGLTLSIGPTGLGNVWHPAQVSVTTTTGAFDTSTFTLFLGPVGIPITNQGSCSGGAGVISLAVPPMSPGQYLIGVWAGGHTGDIAAMNVIGTMDALAPPSWKG